jgi:hypothetical protein
MKIIDKLVCDMCSKLIGYVAEFDLNGSQFYCEHCTEKLKELNLIKFSE